jgi:hypothetical protein
VLPTLHRIEENLTIYHAYQEKFQQELDPVFSSDIDIFCYQPAWDAEEQRLVITIDMSKNCPKVFPFTALDGKRLMAAPRFESGKVVGWDWQGEITDKLGMN